MRKKQAESILKIDNKIHILESAIHIFEKDGINGISIRSISEHAKLSVGTIYLYYKDKTKIIEALQNQSFDFFLKSVKSEKILHSAKENLYQTIDLFIQFATVETGRFQLLFSLSDVKQDLSNKKSFSTEQWFIYLKNMVAKCIEEGSIKHYNQEVVTVTLWATLFGYGNLINSSNHNGFSLAQQNAIIRDSVYFLKEMLNRY